MNDNPYIAEDGLRHAAPRQSALWAIAGIGCVGVGICVFGSRGILHAKLVAEVAAGNHVAYNAQIVELLAVASLLLGFASIVCGWVANLRATSRIERGFALSAIAGGLMLLVGSFVV